MFPCCWARGGVEPAAAAEGEATVEEEASPSAASPPTPASGYPAASYLEPAGERSTASGHRTRYEWWWLGGHHQKPILAEQWVAYELAAQYHLTASWELMQLEGKTTGIVLDLAPFTSPPSPYQVWRASAIEVTNKNAADMFGQLAIAGYPKEFWDLPPASLPRSARQGKVVAGFYQVHSDHVKLVHDLNRYLGDPWASEVPQTPRRRVVLLIEQDRPDFMFAGVDRFRKRTAPEKIRSASSLAVGESDSVPPGEAVFQWWWGNPQSGIGHWKNYHHHVSAKLESMLVENSRFRMGLEPVEIDQVRYCLQRISSDKPFDFLDQNRLNAFREPFLPEFVLTVDSSFQNGQPVFDHQARLTSNCFVQFHKGNPRRRRPVRRVRRGEAAGLRADDGEPCGVCFSESGFLTGCEKGHNICSSCLRFSLRVLVGDVAQQNNLICGCLSASDKLALATLSKRADDSLQEVLRSPPTADAERFEFAAEMGQTQRAFQLGAQVPAHVFQLKVDQWLEHVEQRAREHLYHACASPGCPMENWVLKSDFEQARSSSGRCTWECRAGHQNTVLPSQEDLDQMNKNILLHPEFYTGQCGVDSLQLRRFRLCPMCVPEGLLTFAVHEAGCKQWPGSGSGHRHCFCFHCLKKWGKLENECTHQKVDCQDPGIQQLRKSVQGGVEVLEMGFVDSEEYIRWVREGGVPPPTVFQGSQESGAARQELLGMTDRHVLLRELLQGTQ